MIDNVWLQENIQRVASTTCGQPSLWIMCGALSPTTCYKQKKIRGNFFSKASWKSPKIPRAWHMWIPNQSTMCRTYYDLWKFRDFFLKKKNSAKISANSNMDDSSKGGSDLLPSYTSFLYFLVFQVLSCTSWSLFYFYLWYLAKKANNRGYFSEKHPRRSGKTYAIGSTNIDDFY